MDNTQKKTRIIVVSVIAAILLVLIVVFIIIPPKGTVDNVTDGGDWLFENQWYNYDSGIRTILFIGVTDSKTAGADREVKYVTLLAYNEAQKTYSLLNIDPDTACNVKVVDAKGTADGETYLGRIGDAQKYGDGRIISCRNLTQSVESLLMYVKVDHVICVRVGMQTPSFTSDPLAQLEELIGEFETDDAGNLITSVVYSDISRNRLADMWNTLKHCTDGSRYTIEAHRDGELLVPDDRSLKLLIRDLYFKKVS